MAGKGKTNARGKGGRAAAKRAHKVLEGFLPPVARWFGGAFEQPSPAQVKEVLKRMRSVEGDPQQVAGFVRSTMNRMADILQERAKDMEDIEGFKGFDREEFLSMGGPAAGLAPVVDIELDDLGDRTYRVRDLK